MITQLVLIARNETANYHLIAALYDVSRGAVYRDDTRTSIALDYVRDQTLTVGDIPNMHFFIFNQIGRLHKIEVYCDRSLVGHIRVRYNGAMYLGF